MSPQSTPSTSHPPTIQTPILLNHSPTCINVCDSVTYTLWLIYLHSIFLLLQHERSRHVCDFVPTTNYELLCPGSGFLFWQLIKVWHRILRSSSYPNPVRIWFVFFVSRGNCTTIWSFLKIYSITVYRHQISLTQVTIYPVLLPYRTSLKYPTLWFLLRLTHLSYLIR